MRKRNNRVRFTLNDNELERLNKKVSKSGLSRQGYMLKIIADVVPNDLPEPDYSMFAERLREIGIIINQVAYFANATGMIAEKEYDENVKLLEETIEELMKEIYISQGRKSD